MSEFSDTIIKGKDNPILLTFTFKVPNNPSFGLTGFSDLEVKFGSETYTLLLNPTIVEVISDTQLQLNLGGTSETFSSYFVINGYNATYPDGYQLTSKCLANLTIPKMC